MERFKEDAFKSFLAGTASIVAGSCTHPIDTCKIRMQIQKVQADGTKKYPNLVKGIFVIYTEEGLRRGVYKGIEASMMREGTYSTLRLGLYEPIKRAMGAEDPKTTPVWKKFASGAVSGLIGSAVANPADLLKTRMQASPPGEHHPITWHVKDIWSHQGLMGFYKGLLPTVIRATMLNGTKLGTYDTIKHTLINSYGMEEGKKCQFMASVVAGFCMTVVTSPLDNIKTRIMNQRGQEKHYEGIIDCAKKMVKNEGGLISFYRGFGPQWARFAPFTTIQLLTWELLRKMSGFNAI